MNAKFTSTAKILALLLLAAGPAAACGTDSDTKVAQAGETQIANDAGDVADKPETVTVEVHDYGFGGLPATVAVGTRFTLRNTSKTELHEFVAFKLPGGETRPGSQLLKLAPADLMPLLGEPALVLLQPPGSTEVITAVGDGTLTEPGRYLIMCAIPTGASPAEYLAAAAKSEGGPPQGVAGGAPHFAHGMFAELEVTS